MQARNRDWKEGPGLRPFNGSFIHLPPGWPRYPAFPNLKSMERQNLKTALETILRQWSAGMFKTEHQVRFSLLGRLFQLLGWDVFDPAAVRLDCAQGTGAAAAPAGGGNCLDLVLSARDRTGAQREILVFVSAPGTRFINEELRLQGLQFGTRAGLLVLTDGLRYKLHLPGAAGRLADCLCYDLDLGRDDLQSCCNLFSALLGRERFPDEALETARGLWEDTRRLRLIGRVKEAAGRKAAQTGTSVFLQAQMMITRQEGLYVAIEDLKRLWDEDRPCLDLLPRETGAELPELEAGPRVSFEADPQPDAAPKRLPPISTPYW
jgi:hypothetical protein